ncbi:MAG: hypothetical protein RLY93_11040 [Sumerlaeia bacterium]
MKSPTPPAWLPATLPFSGDWYAFLSSLYQIFTRDFKVSEPIFRGCRVKHNSRIDPAMGQGKEEGFWHLVTRDQWVENRETKKKEKERLPDLKRAGCLPWTRASIENCDEPEIVSWDYEEATRKGTTIRTYVWLKDFDFVVVLERQQVRGTVTYFLVTSFCVLYEGKRKDLNSRYSNRINRVGG